MGYINHHGLETLKRHKYTGVDRSYVSKYIMQPFWSRCVNLFPLWMAPNVITLSGFMFVVASALLSYIYSPKLDNPSPSWVHFMHGLLLFLYQFLKSLQTFDAVDGKQARRTNSSSPLGELFDHGCDATSCALETMAFASTIMSGRHSIILWAASAVPFYFATWESFFTNALILPEINGPTEGLMLIYMMHFFTAIVGARWWTQSFRKAIPFLYLVPLIPEIPLSDFSVYTMVSVGVVPTVGYNIYNVIRVVHARKGSMMNALAMLLPFISLLGGVSIWVLLSPSDVLGNQPHLLLLGSGFAFAYLVARMILAHLCDETKDLKTGMCLSLLFLPLPIANSLTAKLLGGTSLIDERMVLLGYCSFTVGLYIHFAISVTHQITSALSIHCFRIRRKIA